MRVGYARVSTPDQSFDRQREALEESGCIRIFEEVVSGAKTARPVLETVLDYIRPGDTLVVWRLDRLGRSLGKLIELMNSLRERDIGFHSLTEAIDTTTPMGQFYFQITGAFADLERNLIRERTRAGLESARRRGQKGGRRKAIDPKTFTSALQLYEAKTDSVQSICDQLGIAKRSFYRYLASHRNEQNQEV